MAIVVPTLDRPNVRAEAIRAPSTPHASPDAFGAGMGEALQNVAQVASNIYQQERQKANYAAETDAQNQIDTFYNKEIAPEIEKTKGKDALGLPEKVLTKIRAKTDEVYNGLTNDEQKLGFDRWRKQYIVDQERNLNSYVTREYDAYETETYNSFLANSVNAAAQKGANGDVAGVAYEIEQQREKIRKRGELSGDSPDKIQALTVKYETDTHLSVINNLLSFDKYNAAKSYFEANKANIEGTRIDLAKNALDAWKQGFDNKRETLLKKAVGEAISVLEAGETPANLPALQTLASINPELEYELNTAVQDREIAGEIYRLPPSAQKANIQALYKPTVTKRELELRTRLEKIHADTVQLLAKDPATLVQRNKLTPVLPVDIEKPETFSQRQNVRAATLQHYGVRSHGLTSQEISGITLRLDQNAVDQNLSYLNRLRLNTDDEQYELILSDAAKDRPDLLIAGGIAQQNPRVAEFILKGREMAKTNPGAIPKPDSADIAIEIDSYIGPALPPGTKAQLAEAAAYAELFMRKDGKTDAASFDAGNYEKILESLTGGVFEFNGKKTISPVYGMDEDDFDDMMEKISDIDLNGAHLIDPGTNTGIPFTAKRLRSSGTLTYVRDGVYWIETADGVVWGRDNKPYELNLKTLLPRLITQRSGAELLQ